MRFKFHPIESRIMDLLAFPECIEFGKAHKEEIDNNNYIDLLPESNIKLFKSMEEALKPYESRVFKFYFEDSSMPRLICKNFPPFGFNSSDDYLAFLKGLNNEDILKSLLSKIYDLANDNKLIEESDLNNLMDDKNKQIELLENLQISDDEKWKLSKILRQPYEMLMEWVELIEEIVPLFEKFYKEKEIDVIALGRRMEETFNKTKGDAVSEISNNIVKKELLPNGNILVSFINAYSIELNTTSKVQYTRWGLDIETLLKNIKDAEENAIRERVILFKNLGDKTRYEVVRLIGKGIESAKEISEILNVSQATISYHISNLTSSKIIILEKNEGKYNYKVNLDFLEETHKLMLEDFTKFD
ncbi:MAG: winged helix-turn-helix transcriptional regulator [Clostridia bacterium]|nr:winged helix-turn-helix transcriptional regulator [Clostridia bacterium]